MNFQDFILPSSQHKVLKFLCEYMGRDFYDSEIARMLPNVSRASANNALRSLAKQGITKRYFIGNIALNRVEATSRFTKEFRRFIYIVELNPFILQNKDNIKYMSLYGNYIETPFGDTPIAKMFIVTDKKEQVLTSYNQLRYAKHITPILYTTKEYEELKTKESNEWKEIRKGLRLI